jgi:two-component system KDP operon response regulator KdpE
MDDPNIYQYLPYYPSVCVILCVFSVAVFGVSVTGTVFNLYQTLFKHGGFRFYYAVLAFISGVSACRYYELYTDIDSTIPLLIADRDQETLMMIGALLLPVAFLAIAAFTLNKLSPKEAPLLENTILQEKFDNWMKKRKPKTLRKVVRKPNQRLALIISDEKSIQHSVKRCLEKEKLLVIEAETGSEGLSLAAMNYPELVVLDLGLKDMEGLRISIQLREWTLAPIIILANGFSENENMSRTNNGHDYYLPKPFTAGELTNMVSVVLRNLHQNTDWKDESVFQTPVFKIDRGTRVLTVRKKEVHLTPHEHHLLSFLVNHAGQTITLKMIHHEFWGKHMDEDALRRYIHQLRHKIELDPVAPKYILTEPGVGYRLQHR